MCGELLRVVLDPSGAIQIDCAESALADIAADGLARKRTLSSVILTQTSASSPPVSECESVLMKGREVEDTELRCDLPHEDVQNKLRARTHVRRNVQILKYDNINLFQSLLSLFMQLQQTCAPHQKVA